MKEIKNIINKVKLFFNIGLDPNYVTIIREDLEGNSMVSSDCPGYRAFRRYRKKFNIEVLKGDENWVGIKNSNRTWKSVDKWGNYVFMFRVNVGDRIWFKKIKNES